MIPSNKLEGECTEVAFRWSETWIPGGREEK